MLPTLALLGLCSCGGGAASATSSSSPPPLQPCEVANVHFENADAVVIANADGTPASIVVTDAPNDADRAAALRGLTRAYGTPKPDTRVFERPWHYGLTHLTDACGRPASPTPSPSP